MTVICPARVALTNRSTARAPATGCPPRPGREVKSGLMANLNELVGDLEVLDARGDAVPLGSTWSGRPVVLVLIRHFG